MTFPLLAVSTSNTVKLLISWKLIIQHRASHTNELVHTTDFRAFISTFQTHLQTIFHQREEQVEEETTGEPANSGSSRNDH